MQRSFITTYSPLARKAGDEFRINPVVILAQSAIETGWGQSLLSREHHNFFGITAYGKKNRWWDGSKVQLSSNSLQFRTYPDALHSFMDYARLIRSAYPVAAELSSDPQAFAKEIAYSKYISETNGDNRELYRKCLIQLCRKITKLQSQK